MSIKIFFQVLILLLLSFSISGQGAKDTLSSKNQEWNPGIFIGAGLGAVHYSGDHFFSNLCTSTFIGSNAAGPPYSENTGGLASPSNISFLRHPQTVAGPAFNLGFQIRKEGFGAFSFSHFIEASFTQFAGDCSFVGMYDESNNGTYPGAWLAHVIDTAQGKYTQTIWSVGYKFQVEYKKVFLSLGLHCASNQLKINEQVTEHLTGSWNNDMNYGNYGRTNAYSYSNRTSYYTFPLQIGAGGSFKLGRIILKPGFYFSSSPQRGYSLFNLTLDVLSNFKRD
jgi:hypothetical protein